MWTLIDSQQAGSTWYDDYINEEGTHIRRVWNDGEEVEVYRIATKS